MASIVTAYILWFFFGIFGVHHFYLKRDRQAFVWWATLGGLFGLGWIRDFWYLPQYVNEANEVEQDSQNGPETSTGYETDDAYSEEYIEGQQLAANESVADNAANHGRRRRCRPHCAKEHRGKPSVSSARLVGMLAMGFIMGYLVMILFPQNWYLPGSNILVRTIIYVLPPSAVAIGVHLVANIGHLQASWGTCLLGSGTGMIWLLDDPTNIGWSCLLSAGFVYYWGLDWKPAPRCRQPRSMCRRLSTLSVCGTLYLSMWVAALYFNATITTKDGKNIPLREALNNYFNSPSWTETKESLYLLWQHIRVNGFSNLFDPQDKASPYRVLGLTEESSQEDVKARYRQLAKEWHPDKHQDPAMKEQAEKKFLEIQKAYETLSSLKNRPSQKNQRDQRHSQGDDL